MDVTITEEMLKGADGYLSISQKEGLAHYLAIACVDEFEGMFFERFAVKQQIIMGVLAQLYLHQNIEKQKITFDQKAAGVLDCCMSEAEYDRWAGSHIYAQLNRFIKKNGTELSDKAYEMLNDHKTFGIMLDREINRLITAKNDPINRIKKTIETEITPERIEKLMENLKTELEKAQKEVEKHG